MFVLFRFSVVWKRFLLETTNTLRSCRFAKVCSEPHLLWKHIGRCYMSVPARFTGFQQDPLANVGKKRRQTCIMIANMRYGQSSVLLTTQTCQPYQIISCCKFKFRKHHKDLIGSYYDEKNRFNIAKLVRSRPSELRSTNSTEYQMKFFCKFKFRKHQETS